MRLTTKIILSIIAVTFLISLIFIIGFSFTDRKNYKHHSSTANTINFSQENKTEIELPSYNTIFIDEVAFDGSKGGYYNGLSDNCGIYLDLIPENYTSDVLLVPESVKDFISLKTYGDTLKIIIDLPELNKKHATDKIKIPRYSELDLRFNISKIDFTNKIHGLSVIAKNINTDSIKIKSSGNIYIESCNADVLEPLVTTHAQLSVKNSNLKKLNLDLDYAGRWHIEDSNIEEENLTGSKIHNITQSKEESRKINWFPKNKEAQLNVNIKSDTVQIIFPL